MEVTLSSAADNDSNIFVPDTNLPKESLECRTERKRLMEFDRALEAAWRSRVKPNGQIAVVRVNQRLATSDVYTIIFNALISSVVAAVRREKAVVIDPVCLSDSEGNLAFELGRLERDILSALNPIRGLTEIHVVLDRSNKEVRARYAPILCLSDALHAARTMGGRAILFRQVEAAERALIQARGEKKKSGR